MFTSVRFPHAAILLRSVIVLQLSIIPITAQPAEEIFLGHQNAPVTLIEYGSLTCGHCVRFHFRVFPKIAKQYIDTGQVKFIFRDYPTSEAAQRGAAAARCAGEQYYDMLDHLFKHVAQWSKTEDVDTALVQQAVAFGLAQAPFSKCLSDPANHEAVIQSQKQAKEAFGVTGTPSFLINGRLEKGIRKFKELEVILETALATDG